MDFDVETVEGANHWLLCNSNFMNSNFNTEMLGSKLGTEHENELRFCGSKNLNTFLHLVNESCLSFKRNVF